MSRLSFQGTLKKMISEATQPINYYLLFDNDIIHLNQLIDHSVRINFLGYDCLKCHADTPIYRMGHCKRCYYESPTTAEWIIRPELSKAHLDQEDRDLDYEKQVQLQPHIVYLAYTGGLKVGVTRLSQVPTRWIDQGATQAITVLEVPNRYLAGIAEVSLKTFLTDKTNWREMLKDHSKTSIDLQGEKQRILPHLTNELKPYLTKDSPFVLDYPMTHYPTKVTSIKFPAKKSFESVLKGIKGQYLIFESGAVCNIRSHEGYVIALEM